MPETVGPFAPGSLELVRAFVNTLNIEGGTDVLGDPVARQEWMRQHQLLDRGLGADDLARLRTLRESLRAGLLANHDREPLPKATRQALDTAAQWSGATLQFTAQGLQLKPAGDGGRFLAGIVTAAVANALTDGSWSRLKACRSDTCRWAFYDHSRSRTGQWCSMDICGNRNKQARWRRRRSGTEPTAPCPPGGS